MAEAQETPITTPAEPQDDYCDRVDRCLAMVLHITEVQDIAATIKKIHVDRMREKSECDQKQA